MEKFKKKLNVKNDFGEGKLFEGEVGDWLIHYGPNYEGSVPLCFHSAIQDLGSCNKISNRALKF